MPNDILSLSVVQQNVGRRPIVWGITAGREFAGLGEYVVQQGLGFRLETTRPDTTSPALDFRRLAGAPLDIPTTERLVWETYRYAGLLEGDVTRLESTSASIASTLSFPLVQLTYAYSARGEEEKLRRALDYCPEALTQSRVTRRPDGAAGQGEGVMGSGKAGKTERTKGGMADLTTLQGPGSQEGCRPG